MATLAQPLHWYVCSSPPAHAHVAGVAFGPNGDFFAGGGFSQGTIDLDPGADTMELTSTQNYNLFLAKYAEDGTVLWAHAMGDTCSAQVTALVADPSGGVYVTGGFSHGSFDIDPGPASVMMTGNGIANNMFVAHFNAAGDLIWAFDLGAPFAYIFPLATTLDNDGNILISGAFGTGNNLGIDMDPGPGANELTSFGQTDENAFLAKYDPFGNALWAFRIGGTEDFEKGLGVAADEDNNVYITGELLSEHVDLDPGPGQYLVNALNGRKYMLLASYDATGSFRWGAAIGASQMGAGTGGSGITTTDQNNVIVSGWSKGDSIDFDPGPDQALFSGTAAFIARYMPDGTLVWLTPLTSSGTTSGIGDAVSATASGELLVGGRFFDDSLQVAPGGPWLHGSAPMPDAFLCRYDGSGNFLNGFTLPSSNGSGVSSIASYGTSCHAIGGFFAGTGLDLDPIATTPCCDADNTLSNFFFALYNDLGTGFSAAPSNSESLIIQPNPADTGGRLFVHATELIRQLELITVQGSVLRTYAPSGYSVELSLSGISFGTYLARVVLSSGKVVTQSVVIRP